MASTSSTSAVPKSYPYLPPSSPQFSRQRLAGASSVPSTPGVPTFKVPASKNAHHLHTIPPREKSTRTLILDHLLWVHARTRLQQARAELGMTVSMEFVSESGDSPSMDVDKEDTEAQEMSDGEDVSKIKFTTRGQERNQRSPIEDEYESSQSLPLAHSLRLRSDGVEKVLIAMLDQPPEIQPHYSDEDTPQPPPSIHGLGEHHFPNGVRLRLALSTLVNDLFTRDISVPLKPHPSNMPAYQARQSQTPNSTPKVGAQSSSKGTPSSIFLGPSLSQKETPLDDDLLANGLPSVLAPLSVIANYSVSAERTIDGSSSGGTPLPSFSTVTRASSGSTSDTLPPILSSTTPAQDPSLDTAPLVRPRRASGRVLALYEAGVDPSTANSPPSFRCPRHLHHACKVCALAKPPPPQATSYGTGTSPKSPVVSRAAITLGSSGKARISASGAPIATGLVSWKTGAGIGAGLSSPGINGTVLRRRSISRHGSSDPRAKESSLYASAGKLAELIPRFIRLSALVAVELGREAKEKEDEGIRATDGRRNTHGSEDEGDDDDIRNQNAGTATDNITTKLLPASALKPTYISSPYLLALSFRPTREWYAMLTGLLTRAVLEGYLCRGWKGPLGMECLLGVGLSLGPSIGEDKDNEYAHLDPDDCPSLVDAAKILFPTLCRPTSFQRKDRIVEGPEAEYEAEMLERVAEFLTVPPSTPDLSTHFEDLAYKFPAEPIERAVIRFCEAIASWRGKPELENYRKKVGESTTEQILKSPQVMMDSLVQSASGTMQPVTSDRPTKPPIDKYFVPPPPLPPSLNKRRRSNTTTSSTGRSETRSKKTHFETDEWTGPYGI